MSNLISATEAAGLLNVTRVTVHNLVKAGKLTVAAKLGKQEQIFLNRDDVLAFAQAYKSRVEAA